MTTVTPIRKEVEAATEKVERAKPPKTQMEARLLTTEDFDLWTRPRFQRPLHDGAPKVIEYMESLKRSGGIMTGVLTLGQIPDDPATYVVDGSHRICAANGCRCTTMVASMSNSPIFGTLGPTFGEPGTRAYTALSALGHPH